jgi:peptidoglycan/LPS O-acetylase OafA/YrhL
MSERRVASDRSSLLIDPAHLRANNLTLIRLTLALAVLFSHCFPLCLGTNDPEWAYVLTRGQLTLGELAVDAFFMISGFLIMQSWDQSDWPMAYLRKRVLRIYPGFLVATAFSILVVGAVAAPDSGQYLHALRAHAASSIGAALTLNPPLTPPTLVGVPVPNATNGSLWTIRPEFECYLLVILIGSLGLGARAIVTTALFSSLLVARLAIVAASRVLGDGWVIGDQLWNAIRFGLCFLAGAVLYCYRSHVPRRRDWFWVSLGGLVLTAVLGTGLEIWLLIGGAYALFYLAFHSRVVRSWFVANGRDWSYGIYLYAWPIQQLVAWRFARHLTPYRMFGLAVIPTMAAAAVSWILIERPALRFKRRRSGKAPTGLKV